MRALIIRLLDSAQKALSVFFYGQGFEVSVAIWHWHNRYSKRPDALGFSNATVVKIFGNERMILGISIHDIASVLDVSGRVPVPSSLEQVLCSQFIGFV